MKVELLTSYNSIKDMENFAALAALTCHDNTEKDFVPAEVLKRILSYKHESILEHITLTYSVKGISRALLQELARHRHISLSVESTRHTLKKKLRDIETAAILVENVDSILPMRTILNFSDLFRMFGIKKENKDDDIVGDYATFVLAAIEHMLKQSKRLLPDGSCTKDGATDNDDLKYYLPEFWPTNLILTVNIRELRHILNLRTTPQALKEFRSLARELFYAVPDEFKYLLQDCVHEEVENA